MTILSVLMWLAIVLMVAATLRHRRSVSSPGPVGPPPVPGLESRGQGGGRVTADLDDVDRVTFTPATDRVTASSEAGRRELSGGLVEWMKPGKTSRGLLRIAAGALRIPEDPTDVKLTREHDRGASRGHLIQMDEVTAGLRATVKVADGPEGDDALREAQDKTRNGFSVDLENVRLVGDTIVSADLVAIGQVGIPAYGSTRIDRVAASSHPTNPGEQMNAEQKARLAALRAQANLTQAEAAELVALAAMERDEEAKAEETKAPEVPAQPAAPEAEKVTAAMPATPSGSHRPATTTAARGGALGAFVAAVCDHYRQPAGSRSIEGVTAALADITQTGVGGDVSQQGWSGELWSGVQYEPEFTPLLSSGDLTYFEGKGWRWVTKPVMDDYAGDKAAIPSVAIATESSTYEASRLAVGHDIDRKFYDFPDEAFLASYLEACRESWAQQLDDKVHADILAAAVVSGESGGGSTWSAIRKALRYLRRTKVGRGTFVILADSDYDTLMDTTTQDVPAFLDLVGMKPENLVPSADLLAGTVVAGAKAARQLRTPKGSPIRVTAQNLVNGGVDEAFFGYYAIEEHHSSGVVSATIA